MTTDDLEQLSRIAADRAPGLVLFARQWLDAAEADDAVQEAVVALLSQRQPPFNPGAWLYRAVRNAAIDIVRSANRRRRREQTVAAHRPELFDQTPMDLIDADTAQKCLQRLTHEHREIVVLRLWGELSFAEIADIVELSVSTVHQKYHLALRRMRSMLEQSCPRPINCPTN
jgi:RNA polymerase sigma factor (sigma-70 family)